MKNLLLSAVLFSSTHALLAQKGAELLLIHKPVVSPPVTVLVPVTSLMTPTAPGPTIVYEQRLMGGRAPLVTPEQAQAVIARFKAAYAKAGSPRILIIINQKLLETASGLQLSERSEAAPTTQASEAPLADRQTMRDVERLFGRPLRMGGAAIVDQSVAAHLETRADNGQARLDREAMAKITDVVLEVLISSRNQTVRSVSGDAVVSVPDIQVSAIRLSDLKIIGQATAADLLNRAGTSAHYYDVREVSEATALSLMEDMAL